MIPERTERWSTISPSRLKTYMRCARQFFFEQVRGWESEYPNSDYAFGTAWHRALEILLKCRARTPGKPGYSDEAVEEAKAAFEASYFQQGLAADREPPKNLTNGLLAIEQYAAYYQADDFEVVVTEHAGEIELPHGQKMRIRIDAMLRDPHTGKVWIQEHKTTTRSDAKSEQAWWQSIQVGAYEEYLYKIGDGQFPLGGVEVNLAVFRNPPRIKKDGTPYANSGPGNEFVRVPITLRPEQRQAWKDVVTSWSSRLTDDYVQLETADQADLPTMQAFQRNPESCWRCAWLDFCIVWANPLQVDEPPIGYKVKELQA